MGQGPSSPRRLVSRANPCSNASAVSSASSLALHLRHSADTYTVIRLLNSLLTSSASASPLARLCSLNITLRHAYFSDDAVAGDGRGSSSSHRPSAAVFRMALIVGVAAGCVGLSLALAMHLAYRYNNKNSDEVALRHHSMRRSSSGRHRRRSTQVRSL